MLQRKSTVGSIKNAKSIQEINKYIEEFKKFIDNTETLVEEEKRLKAEKLAKAKADAIKEIDNYVLLFNYNVEEKNKILELRNSIVLKINNSEYEYIIRTFVNEYKQNVGDIKSNEINNSVINKNIKFNDIGKNENKKNSLNLIYLECNDKIKKLLEDKERITYKLKNDKIVYYLDGFVTSPPNSKFDMWYGSSGQKEDYRLYKITEQGFSERIKNYKTRLLKIEEDLISYNNILNKINNFIMASSFYHLKLNKKFTIISFEGKNVSCVDENGIKSSFSIIELLKNNFIEY